MNYQNIKPYIPTNKRNENVFQIPKEYLNEFEKMDEHGKIAFLQQIEIIMNCDFEYKGYLTDEIIDFNLNNLKL